MIQKSQTIRLFDVFVLAPALTYISTNKKLSGTERGILLFAGVSTFIYNGINYLKNKELQS